MSLWGSQAQALVRIEQNLQASDPRLKSLFTSFTRLTEHEQMPGREQLRRRWRAYPHLVVTIALLVILSGIATVVVAVPGGRCAVARTSVGSLPFPFPRGTGDAPAAAASSPRPAC